LKQRLDFPFEEEIEAMDRLPKIQRQKVVETTVWFSTENQIETMDILTKSVGQKNC